ncbi:hypothetical protein ABE501_16455 [Comamonas testosteroni]
MSIKTAAIQMVDQARLTAQRHFAATKPPGREANPLGRMRSNDLLRAGLRNNICRKQ